MSTALKQQQKDETIFSVAGDVCGRAKDKEEAVEQLARTIRRSPALVNAAIYVAAESLARDMYHASRNFTAKKVSAGSDSADGLVICANEFLDTYRMSNGVRLGDADADLIENDASWHERLAKANGNKAAFLRAIQKKLGKAARVRDAISDEDAQKMYKKFGNG